MKISAKTLVDGAVQNHCLLRSAPLCGQTKSIWQSMASEPQTKTSTLARKLDDKKKRIRLGKIFRSAASALLA
jgi:hypothetical protein